MISPTIFEALGDPIAKVTDAGIPVIVIDSGAKTDKYASFLTTNNEAGGKAAADAIAACIKDAHRQGGRQGRLSHRNGGARIARIRATRVSSRE